MLRLTFLLVIGLGLVMLNADRLPVRAEPVQVATLDVSVLPEANDLSISSSREISATQNGQAVLMNASLEIAEPTITEPVIELPVRVAAPRMTRFSTPVVVHSNGEITLSKATVPEELPAIEIAEATITPTYPVRFVAASRLNVRAGPSTNNDVIDQILLNDAVQVLTEPVDGWVLIRIEGDGVEGYVANRLLQDQDPLE